VAVAGRQEPFQSAGQCGAAAFVAGADALTVFVRQVLAREEPLVQGLCALLIDVVEHGASVGFLAPLVAQTAARYWNQAFSSLGTDLHLWVAQSQGVVVGSVQLLPSLKENGLHRAEIQKLLVLQSYRGQGIAGQLMQAAEAFACSNKRTLLVLDTQAGSPAEAMYRHLQWQKAGEIPGYAAGPDGQLRATAYYFKRLTN
jgi:acetyltransferase